jgi:hypothetical protein
VAGFHSLVGIAAAATAIGDFMVHDYAAHPMDAFHSTSLYMGAWMGEYIAHVWLYESQCQYSTKNFHTVQLRCADNNAVRVTAPIQH